MAFDYNSQINVIVSLINSHTLTKEALSTSTRLKEELNKRVSVLFAQMEEYGELTLAMQERIKPLQGKFAEIQPEDLFSNKDNFVKIFQEIQSLIKGGATSSSSSRASGLSLSSPISLKPSLPSIHASSSAVRSAASSAFNFVPLPVVLRDVIGEYLGIPLLRNNSLSI